MPDAPPLEEADTLGAALRLGRLAKRKRQVDAALALGVAQSTLSAWENDVWVPSFEQVVRAARLYGLDPGDLARRITIDGAAS